MVRGLLKSYPRYIPGSPQVPQVVRGHLPETTGLGSCPNSTSSIMYCTYKVGGPGNSNSCGRRRHCVAFSWLLSQNADTCVFPPCRQTLLFILGLFGCLERDREASVGKDDSTVHESRQHTYSLLKWQIGLGRLVGLHGNS